MQDVVFRVTGAASGAEARYGVNTNISSEPVASLPWERVVSRPVGAFEMYSLDVTTSAQGAAVSCEILVGGVRRAQSTSSGGFARPAHCVVMPGL